MFQYLPSTPFDGNDKRDRGETRANNFMPMTCQLDTIPTKLEQMDPGVTLLREASAYIRENDDAGLTRYLRRSWSVGDLANLLHGDDSVVAWMAAYCLSVVGGPVAVIPLARALHHDDPAVVSAAEDGLWRVWFDEAGKGVRNRLQRASESLGEDQLAAAIAILDDIIARNPDFAEAYNQRGIVRYLLDDPVGTIADCKRAVRLNACHFGAYASMGHARVHLGDYDEALSCYRAALDIHPRMEGIRQSIRKIRSLRLPIIPAV